MIYLSSTSLAPPALQELQSWQSEVMALPNYADQVTEAKRLWPLRNRRDNRTFAEVRIVLSRMCSGHTRCAYCEDSGADEIDHVRPKDLYPEQVFAWENYLFCCGACNGEKRNHHAVFTDVTGDTWSDVTRKPNDPVIPPLAGDPLLINPRNEDPLHFMMLDFRGTFGFVPVPGLTPREQARVKYTVNTLNLNRAELLRGRRTAFTMYANTLHRYVSLQKADDAQDDRDNCIAALQNAPHTTIWHEMKRWHVQFPNTLGRLNTWFNAAPEALTW